MMRRRLITRTSIAPFLLLLLPLISSIDGIHAAPSDRLERAAAKQQTPFTFDDIFDSRYRSRSFSPNWISGQDAFTYRSRDSGAVMKYDAVTGTETVLFDNTTFNLLETGTYFISPDIKYALFAYEVKSQWRHSFFAKYKILDIATNTLTAFPTGPLNDSVLQFAGWSPTNHSLSFVYGNNLYIQTDVASAPDQVTTDGDPMYTFNGVPDWLYEEDVISDRVSHYWSPDNRYICYARINDTGVPLQAWPWYGPVSDVFGSTIHIAYPKAGDVRDGKAGPNTKVQLYVAEVATQTAAKLVSPPSALQNVDHYYLGVSWRDATNVFVIWANRVQNNTFSVIYDVTASAPLTGVINLNHTVSGGWAEVPPPTPWFIEGGARYLTVHPLQDASIGPWLHLAVITSASSGAGSIIHLTSGTHEVQYVAGYNNNTKVVYFVTTGGDPAERHIARVGLPEADAANRPYVCLTCSYPETCRYLSTSFSGSTLYYMTNCLGPDVPSYTLRSLVPGEENRANVMESNDLLRDALSEKLLPTREFFNVSIGGGQTGRAEIFIPPNYTPGERRPLLVYAYAGPGSQRVMKTFPMGGSTTNWLTYLKSSHRIVVASLDGRGSMAAGDNYKFLMYRKLGLVEVEDQILGGAAFQQGAYVDNTKDSAIFGWSYGGGTTAHVMGNESQVFKCGVSVAPVTTKRYYDTAYTERFLALATPDDDELGYNNTEVMRKAPNFHGKKFMISHGTADDNVHFMHTMHLISALADSDVLFRSNLYMDQNHNINSPGQSRHLYHTMSDFLVNDCWALNSTNPLPSPRGSASALKVSSILLVAAVTILVV